MRRILDYYKDESSDTIHKVLSKVYGVEIDRECYDKAIGKLNVVLREYGLPAMQ